MFVYFFYLAVIGMGAIGLLAPETNLYSERRIIRCLSIFVLVCLFCASFLFLANLMAEIPHL